MADPAVEVLGLGAFALGSTTLGAYGFSLEAQALTAEGVRVLDPGTGDYLSIDGVIQRFTAGRQRIIIALATKFGSSMAVRGMQFEPVHDETTGRITEQEARSALSQITADGSIQIPSITVQPMAQAIPGRLGISVQFIDTLTGESGQVDA